MEGKQLTHTDFIVNKNGVYLNKQIGGGNPGMILIWADWCGHCQRFKPTFNQLRIQLGKEFPCVSIEDSELKQDENLISALNFQGYPTIKFFDQNGKIIGEYNKGDRSKDAMLNHICEVYHHCMQYH